MLHAVGAPAALTEADGAPQPPVIKRSFVVARRTPSLTHTNTSAGDGVERHAATATAIVVKQRPVPAVRDLTAAKPSFELLALRTGPTGHAPTGSATDSPTQPDPQPNKVAMPHPVVPSISIPPPALSSNTHCNTSQSQLNSFPQSPLTWSGSRSQNEKQTANGAQEASVSLDIEGGAAIHIIHGTHESQTPTTAAGGAVVDMQSLVPPYCEESQGHRITPNRRLVLLGNTTSVISRSASGPASARIHKDQLTPRTARRDSPSDLSMLRRHFVCTSPRSASAGAFGSGRAQPQPTGRRRSFTPGAIVTPSGRRCSTPPLSRGPANDADGVGSGFRRTPSATVPHLPRAVEMHLLDHYLRALMSFPTAEVERVIKDFCKSSDRREVVLFLRNAYGSGSEKGVALDPIVPHRPSPLQALSRCHSQRPTSPAKQGRAVAAAATQPEVLRVRRGRSLFTGSRSASPRTPLVLAQTPRRNESPNGSLTGGAPRHAPSGTDCGLVPPAVRSFLAAFGNEVNAAFLSDAKDVCIQRKERLLAQIPFAAPDMTISPSTLEPLYRQAIVRLLFSTFRMTGPESRSAAGPVLEALEPALRVPSQKLPA